MSQPEATQTTADPFMAAVRGRFALSTDAGAASSWFEPGEVPLPDREYGTLWWWALAGLNHFYLRSVLPGLFKVGLLIVGGLLAIARSATAFLPIVAFGVWWAWDLLQLSTEKERVITYGMTTPFDYTTGIGQGMIVDGHTNYRQRADFVGWQLMSALGPLGVDALLQGRPGLFVRKLIDTILFSSFASGLFKGLFSGGVSDAGLFFLFLFAALFGFFVLLPWLTTITALGHPSTMFKDGIKISSAFEKFLNFFDSWTSSFGENTHAEVRHDFGIASVPGADLRRDFKIFRRDPSAPAEKEETGGSPVPGLQEQTTWPMSVGLGNAITGPIAALIAKFIIMFRVGVETYYAAARESRGEAAFSMIGSLPIPGADKFTKEISRAVSLNRARNLVAQAKGQPFTGLSVSTSSLMDRTSKQIQGAAGALTEEAKRAAQGTVGALTEEAKQTAQGAVGALTEEAKQTAQGAVGALTEEAKRTAQGAVGALTEEAKRAVIQQQQQPQPLIVQSGGAAAVAAPSWESVVLGATVAALAAGGAIKATVDYLVRE